MVASKRAHLIAALLTGSLAGAGVGLVGTAAEAAGTQLVSVYASDDAYTSSVRRTVNTGQADKLVAGRIDGDTKISYLRFTVGKPAEGVAITGAQLRLVTDGHAVPGTLSLLRVASTSWS
jgi:hypothetical protein